MIIHISGPSGSGKSFLGKLLEEKYKNKIIVKDLDILRDEFIEFFYKGAKFDFIDEVEYQKYIDNFIKRKRKPIIFVGLNDNNFGKKDMYYDVHADHKYYILLDDKIILKQKCNRLFNEIQQDEIAMDDLMNDNEKFLKLITKEIQRECNFEILTKMSAKWKSDYEKQGYKIMSQENIYKNISRIIDNHLKIF